MGVSKGEVSILEDIFPCGGIILCDASMIDASREFGRDVFVVLLQLSIPVWVGPEDSIGISVEGGDPVTLGADLLPLPCGSTADHEFLTFSKLDRVVILGLDGLEVFDDGPKVDVMIAEDIVPEGVWEQQAISLSIKTADGILGVEVVNGLEHLGFLDGADVHSASPGRSSPTHTPVPGIMWVMDIIIISHPL